MRLQEISPARRIAADFSTGADYLINCAALIPPKSDHNPNGTYLSNFLGTKNLVDEIIKRGNNIPYVHVATVAMYGHRAYPHVWGARRRSRNFIGLRLLFDVQAQSRTLRSGKRS